MRRFVHWLTTPRPDGRGFRPSPAGVPVSQPIAPGRSRVSDISSAGSHRLTSGQDVRGGVDVPVVPGTAGRACPVACPEGQFGEQVPARRAGLRRWVPAVDHDQASPVALAFVLQLAAELTPAAVTDHAGQAPVADHPGDVEVLDHDQVVAADQARAGAVQKVTPGVTDLAVRPGDLDPGLGPVRRPFPAAGQPPLVAGQVPRLALQVAGIGDPLPARISAAGPKTCTSNRERSSASVVSSAAPT